FFFFQAEDGIRDFHVTGVQTCALPIYSALIYTKEGIIQSLKNNEVVMYHRFLLTSGSAYYFQKKYDQALDSLKKLQPTIKDDNRLAMCLYYKAKIYEHKKNDKAIEVFSQVDS